MNRLLIFCVFIFSTLQSFAQIDSANAKSPLIKTRDTLITSNSADTLTIPPLKEPGIIQREKEKHLQETSPILTNSSARDTLIIPKDTSSGFTKNIPIVIKQLELPAIRAIKQIGFFTIINIFILMLIGVGLVKILEMAVFKFQVPIFARLKTTLKVLIWLIIFYLILTIIISEPNQIMIYIIVSISIIFAIATISFFKNIVGGFFLSLNEPFRINDFISIENYEGEVQKINWRTTIIITVENSIVHIPNSFFLIHPIKNINRGQKEQLLTIPFEIKDNFDPIDFKKILIEAALSSPYTFLKKESKVYLIKYDIINRKYIFELHVYLKEGKFENDFINSINMSVSTALKN